MPLTSRIAPSMTAPTTPAHLRRRCQHLAPHGTIAVPAGIDDEHRAGRSRSPAPRAGTRCHRQPPARRRRARPLRRRCAGQPGGENVVAAHRIRDGGSRQRGPRPPLRLGQLAHDAAPVGAAAAGDSGCGADAAGDDQVGLELSAAAGAVEQAHRDRYGGGFDVVAAVDRAGLPGGDFLDDAAGAHVGGGPGEVVSAAGAADRVGGVVDGQDVPVADRVPAGGGSAAPGPVR